MSLRAHARLAFHFSFRYLRYLLVGGFVGLVAIFAREIGARALPDTPFWYGLVIVLIYLSGIFLSYFLQRKYTFRDVVGTIQAGELWGFVVASIATGCVTVGLSYFFRYNLGFERCFGVWGGGASFGVAVLIGSFLNFVLNLKIVFGISVERRRRLFSTVFWVFLAVLSAASCVLWSFLAGKDMNWDSLNYHYYIAYQWSNDRLDKDFLASSIQSYLNPISYLPFYYMVQANWSSGLITTVLAGIHSVNLVLIAVIADALLPTSKPARRLWIIFAIFLAGINPVYLVEVGSTFNDVIASIPVLMGYALIIKRLKTTEETQETQGVPRFIWFASGLLIGVSVGMKLTNLIFVMAFVPMIFAERWRTSGMVCMRGASFALGSFFGFMAINGWWAWKLFEKFGNPFFPYFNSIFRSPDFPAFSIRNYRFIPENFLEALAVPLSVIKPEQNIYTETAAPDLRFAVYFALGAAAIFLCLYRNRRISVFGAQANGASARKVSVLACLCVSWLLCYIFWLYTSGNGRYFMPAMLLLGPLLVALTINIFAVQRYSFYLLGLIIFWQTVQISEGAGRRWTGVPWTEKWFEVSVPSELLNNPYLYLIPSMQTSMFVAPYLNQNSSFASIAGQVSLPEEGPGGRRVASMISSNSHRVRSLFAVRAVGVDGLPLPDQYSQFDGVFYRFGLRSDLNSCQLINAGNLGANAVLLHTSGSKDFIEPSGSTSLISCALLPTDHASVALEEQKQRVDEVFNRIEAACPGRYDPPGLPTERIAGGWGRKYVNTDTDLLSSDDGLITSRSFGGGEPLLVGTIEDWGQETAPRTTCLRKVFYKSPLKKSSG